MSEPSVLTIDLGTSGVKAAVVTADGRIEGIGHRHIPTLFTPDDGAEQDPDVVWRAVLDSAGDALTSPTVHRASVLAIIVASQYSSVVAVDAAGRHVANMIVWMDQRATPKRLARLPGYPRLADTPADLVRWLRIHGLPPIDSAMSLSHMRWMKYAHPDLYARTASFLEPVDFLNLRLTGRAAANQCSALMMLTTDNRALGAVDHHPGLVAQSLIDGDKLPPLLPVGAEVGTLLPEVAAELGLDTATVVVGGLNDSQAGAIVSGAFEGTHAGLSIGTTGVFVTHVDRKKTNPLTSLFTMPGPFADHYLVSAENGVAGAAVDHFLDRVVDGDDAFGRRDPTIDRYAALNETAASVAPGAGGVLFLPWLRGSLAPTADARLRGAFVNLGLGTTRAELARAVLEGVALNLRRLRGPVEKFVGRELSHVVLYGGGARSDLWSQIVADVLGLEVRQLDEPSHAVGLGAGLFAFERLGVLERAELGSVPRVRRVFAPDRASATRYDELAGHFAAAFKRTRPLFHALNSH